jgi:hypothetical protein
MEDASKGRTSPARTRTASEEVKALVGCVGDEIDVAGRELAADEADLLQ